MDRGATLPSPNRDYKHAIGILNTRRRPKRPSPGPDGTMPVLSDIPSTNRNPDLRGTPSIAGMKEWLHLIGHSMTDIDRLNIIHVAGTKGKRQHLRLHRILPKSPRTKNRLPTQDRSLHRDLFAKYFFEVWDALTRSSGTLPRYLQLLALVSFHTFIREGVEVAIVETHHGGEYDATNVIEHPVVTVITPLGMDHVKQLGPTIESIAWHKAGIFKAGCPSISSVQGTSAANVLRSRSSEEGVNLEFIELDSTLPDAPQLRPDVQRMNCSVALAAVDRFLQEKNAGPLSSSDKIQGIRQFSWPGRFQHVIEDKFNWFLDGAHNEMSVVKAAEWFIDSTQAQRGNPTRTLIFGQVSNQRDGVAVLQRLAAVLCRVKIHHVIFALYDPKQGFDFESTPDMIPGPETVSQRVYGEAWKRLHRNSHVLYEPNVQQALDTARKLGAASGDMQTLITGSQHLVGAALFYLNGGVLVSGAPNTT
ncbi:hypothetical protein CEP52_015371 [Fusarium oligoseptatum]|uniref:tetrahydrofolate synthase n=1 Tax=Fusarium oligoseptatum TaxID=2604345 RepID=A0A428SDL2_9HYPO|nr:hypothetical protein CEP52_015371 [Fusarium oligoseptatum]